MDKETAPLPGRSVDFLRALVFEDTFDGELQRYPIIYNLLQYTQLLIFDGCIKEKLCDPGLVESMLTWLRPGDTFIDIGANMGYFTVLASKRVGKSGHVYSFEPNPIAFSSLALNQANNKPRNINLHPWAISDIDGIVEFHTLLEDDGLSSLIEANTDTGQEGRTRQTIKAQSYRIDSLYEKGVLPACRVMKLDIEGCEDRAIAGGNKYFSDRKADAVVFEMNNNVNVTYDERQLREFFHDLGYTCFLIRPHGAWAEKYQSYFPRAPLLKVGADPLPFDLLVGNILAIKPEVMKEMGVS